MGPFCLVGRVMCRMKYQEDEEVRGGGEVGGGQVVHVYWANSWTFVLNASNRSVNQSLRSRGVLETFRVGLWSSECTFEALLPCLGHGVTVVDAVKGGLDLLSQILAHLSHSLAKLCHLLLNGFLLSLCRWEQQTQDIRRRRTMRRRGRKRRRR